MNKKFIACESCKYFPNKADQANQHCIRISAGQIHWSCQACARENVYNSNQVIFLPETTLVAFQKRSLLSKDAPKPIRIDVRLGDATGKRSAYYCPQFREQIEKECGIELKHVKNLGTLEKQSKWFAQYRQFLLAFGKLGRNHCKRVELITVEDYVVYLFERFIACKFRREIEVVVTLSKQDRVFSFSFSQEQSDSLKNFLKIYALLQFDDKQAWFYKLYRGMLQKYEDNSFAGEAQTQLLIDTSSRQNPIILKQSGERQKSFAINPLSDDSFIRHIQSIKIYHFSALFFKKKSQNEILKVELPSDALQNARLILQSSQTTTQTKQLHLKKQLKKMLYEKFLKERVKLLKLFCQFEDRIILLTFGWQKVERDLVEQLDEEVEEQYRLKEDVLSEQFIRLSTPSPFLKKRQYSHPPAHQDQEEEEYL